MKKSGASLAVFALEQIGVRFTFGIPGVHNTELYDELSGSKSIRPILVTHECGAAFMADAVSRTSDSIGTLLIVPAAGMTHAMSGIGEAFLDGIPMLIISGGVRTDTGKKYQLHQIDQMEILKGITKKSYRISEHKDIISTIYEAYEVAITDECGPVFVEIPVNIQLFRGEVYSMPPFKRKFRETAEVDGMKIEKACSLLKFSKSPGVFVGWGGRDAGEELLRISELLNAPVATTLQGLSVFPASHPNHTGMGFGSYSVPAGEAAFSECDCLLAVGTRFSEIPTGSFGMKVPKNLIHIDINPEVFSKNYPAEVEIEGDAKTVLSALIEELEKEKGFPRKDIRLTKLIREKKTEYAKEWMSHLTENRINPYLFFEELRRQMADTDLLVVDDGNHTFLAEELFPVNRSKTFLSPTDFNSMGYCVPASIGAKMANPKRKVAGIAGDGAFLMTGMELLTASVYSLGVVIFVFYDGELSQISQGQEIPYGRKTCTVLGGIELEGIAKATGSSYLVLRENEQIEKTIRDAFRLAENGFSVLVDVKIDYSKRTRFTKGVVKVNLGRFPLAEKFRFIGRALLRKITG
ncbi:thiamine pyrophosphate-binding protein [Leptospira fluminis]|uniref:Thiamine pyrophosphate-binding protein n=1 Tax=Leptospira fluminis TaxID=2484979 RepID=A0A4R9GQS7_9LEPT|nr:thiamine pyrophosphate-binding protein [Leptospira fluminis]TGK18715.1 thiamine pyrophosphate-binding protein [Leptospira fluminis]